jgi:biopolymer transport protein ExbB
MTPWLLAAARASTRVHGQLARGVHGLAAIAAVAPLLGFLLTLNGIAGAFQGVDGEKTSIMAAIAGALSEALALSALGILAGLLSMACHLALRRRLACFQVEMHTAALELCNRLARLPPRKILPAPCNFFPPSPASPAT